MYILLYCTEKTIEPTEYQYSQIEIEAFLYNTCQTTTKNRKNKNSGHRNLRDISFRSFSCFFFTEKKIKFFHFFKFCFFSSIV